LGFNGDLYPTAGASVVMTTSGDMVKYESGARARLGIGSANQILQVKSSLPSWETVDLADTVLTTAGDLLYENATPELARLGAGTQYYNLQMGASLPAWSASSSSVLTASGDVLYASGANTLAKLAKASDGDTLQLASGVPAWVTVSAGGGSVVRVDAQEVTGSSVSALTFTPSSAITEAEVACVWVSYTLQATESSSTQLRMEVNNLTNLYNTQGVYEAGGQTSINETGQSTFYLNQNGSATQQVSGDCWLHIGDASFSGEGIRFNNLSQASTSAEWVAGNNTNTATTLSEIELSFASGDIAVGSKMTVFEVQRE